VFSQVNAVKIVDTFTRLETRIRQRFPQSGLLKVCGEGAAIARRTARMITGIERPDRALRIGVIALIALGVAAQIAAGYFLHFERISTDPASLVTSLEAAVNLLVLFGVAAYFLFTLEERGKRRQVLAALHELRSLAHVVDMHQLTKDPTVVLSGHQPTPDSPERMMSEFELTRYLDYCAEMLALIGKLAALYAERSRDAVVIDAVSEVETLTANLGRKIWQKIMIIGQLDERRAREH
jgi:hypothetical protein